MYEMFWRSRLRGVKFKGCPVMATAPGFWRNALMPFASKCLKKKPKLQSFHGFHADHLHLYCKQNHPKHARAFLQYVGVRRTRGEDMRLSWGGS